MLRSRALRSGTHLVLALFVATNALPRASIYFHQHTGGGHTHVHVWGYDVVVHDDEDEPHHHHHVHEYHDHDDDAAAHDGPGVAEPDHGHPWHAHSQSPFQHATPAAVAAPAPRLCAQPLVGLIRLAAGRRPAPPRSARAPPPLRGA